MEGINDLIWIPESEDDNSEDGDFDPTISPQCENGIEDACLWGNCQIVGNTYACKNDIDYRTGSCLLYT